jgi:formate dehydrogenase
MTTTPIAPRATADATHLPLRGKAKLKGRQPEAQALAQVRALIGEGPWRRDLLMEYLHLLQDAYRGLYERHLVALAHGMKISMAEVYEVATFYHHFDVLRDGDTAPALTVRVCDGLSCEMGGAKALLARVSTLLGPQGVRVVPVPCVGRCAQAPVAVVHQRPVPVATAQAVAAIAAQALDFEQNRALAPDSVAYSASEFVANSDPVSAVGGDCDALAPPVVRMAAYRAAGGYALAAALACGGFTAEQALQALEDAGLRGLGGAGFAAARKWRIVREQPCPRLMAVNIDEGEPGTFKDRTYLERDPHRFLEGMLVAAVVVGVEKVFIYLRDEYHGCRALLSEAIAELQAHPPCPLPEIELRRGAGAYICGEESAMVESIEGKRGAPRMRPPYIAQVGLFGRPTLEHNFETLYWVRDILQKGPQWFAGFGRHGRKGLRSFSVSGRVRLPGVKLAPAGITLRELVEEYCGGMLEGHTLYAYLPGGASGGIFPAALADVPLDFDTLQPYGGFIGSAAVIVLSQHDSARDAARNMMRFFAHESCGQCTPCRVGTAKASALMAADVWDTTTLEDLAQVMEDASICGLGQAAPNPLRSVLRYFPQEVSGQGATA